MSIACVSVMMIKCPFVGFGSSPTKTEHGPQQPYSMLITIFIAYMQEKWAPPNMFDNLFFLPLLLFYFLGN